MSLAVALLSALLALSGSSSRAPRGGGGPAGAAAQGGYCDPATGCNGGTTFYGSTARSLVVIDLSGATPRVLPVGDFGAEVTDLARAPDGTLYAVGFDSLYRVDQRTGRATLVGSLGVNDVNGLVWGGQGLLASSTDGLLYEVSPATGAARPLGSFGPGIGSSGDLCFGPGGALYMTSPEGGRAGAPDRLVRVDPRTGAAAVVGPTGTARVYGLAWVDGALTGVTESGALVRLDLRTGGATTLGTAGLPFWGAS